MRKQMSYRASLSMQNVSSVFSTNWCTDSVALYGSTTVSDTCKHRSHKHLPSQQQASTLHNKLSSVSQCLHQEQRVSCTSVLRNPLQTCCQKLKPSNWLTDSLLSEDHFNLTILHDIVLFLEQMIVSHLVRDFLVLNMIVQ